MPLPDSLPATTLVAVIDADDQALAWVKNLAKAPDALVNTIPRNQLSTSVIKNEVFVVYGDKHPLHQPDTESDNIAQFNVWLELNDFGTTFDATGSRATAIPMPVCITSDKC
jgi:hypothetical protein